MIEKVPVGPTRYRDVVPTSWDCRLTLTVSSPKKLVDSYPAPAQNIAANAPRTGDHWEEPGKLAKDGQVFYHVVILSDDEANPVKTHVLVNAIDGTIFKVGKELPRTMRRPEQR